MQDICGCVIFHRTIAGKRRTDLLGLRGVNLDDDVARDQSFCNDLLSSTVSVPLHERYRQG